MQTTKSNTFLSLLGEVGQILRSWWEVDRIRVSPRAGRLLRIHPPCLISIDERMIEVVSRSVSQGPSGPSVGYQCRTPEGPAELRVSLPSSIAAPEVEWIEWGRRLFLSEDDVQVWG